MHNATAIDRAVIHFANSSDGDVEWIAPYHALCIGAYRVPFVIDFNARTLTVMRIYRPGPF